jgi:hypothetical protein
MVFDVRCSVLHRVAKLYAACCVAKLYADFRIWPYSLRLALCQVPSPAVRKCLFIQRISSRPAIDPIIINKRGEKLGLAEDEVAFYDALETNDSAVKALGDENLRFIARELLKTIRENVTIDWTAKESVRAKLRVMVKRILRKHGYPPDKQEKATKIVLEQAELLCADWAA